MTIKVTYNVTDVYVTQDVSPVYINVSYSSGSSGGAAVWGGITGTLSDQTDLQNALNAKFDDPTGDTTQYIAGDGSLVAFPITGQAGTLVREVRNVTGATLTKGTVCYINGASGNRPTVAKALATGDATSAQTFGLIQADIPNNTNGYLVAFGDLDGLNTSAFAEGVQLYLSATTAGAYTSTKQYAPNHLVYIGVVTRQHVNQGRIEVRIQNGYEMDELHDVAAQTPSNNDGLFYNSTNSLWENKSIATALGYTPANAATTLTINGVTFDLSANRTFTVGSVTGSGASGQVAYWTGTSAQAGSANFLWDNTNSNLAIGAATTWQAGIGKLSVVNGATDAPILSLKNTNATKQVYYASYNDSNKSLQYIVYGSTAPGTLLGQFRANAAVILGFNTPSVLAIGNFENVPLVLGTNNAERLRIFGGGNVGINTGTTDSGERLQVTGTMKVTGNVAVDTNTLFVDTTNKRIGVRTATPSAGIDVWNNGTIEVAQFRVSDSRISIPSYSSTGFNPTLTSSTCGFFAPSSSSVGGVQFAGFTTNSASASPFVFVGHHGSNAPTIAALRFIGFKHDGSTNRTALTGNEIIAGFSAGFNADVFQVKANGRINMSSLPTSSTGLATGDLWNDAGTIKIV
jgi:hypothetical protein